MLLTDPEVRFKLPDGTTDERAGKAGEAVWNEAVTHLPENLSDEALEVVPVELKTTGDRGGSPTSGRKSYPSAHCTARRVQ